MESLTGSLRIVTWNSNEATQHNHEIQTLLASNILPVSETHFKIHNYKMYPKPSDKSSRRGCNNRPKFYQTSGIYQMPRRQYLRHFNHGWKGKLALAAVYCPPKYTIKTSLEISWQPFYHWRRLYGKQRY